MSATRAIGLDVGMKTIGVALSDELRIAGHPLETVRRQGTAADARTIADLVVANGVTDIVVGLPLELSGAAGHRVKRVRVFVDALRPLVTDRAAIHEWDERFSTVAVERVMIDADLSRARRKQVVDKQAAAYILQGWLDAQKTE
jgi:putative Holliday junction resolvase